MVKLEQSAVRNGIFESKKLRFKILMSTLLMLANSDSQRKWENEICIKFFYYQDYLKKL